eukprot:TRINITY_DN5433_c0_g1_i1.p1 TRINITY_DN5433_c0_g1~~TRINITY_DN5433_c0_g1_i1.p1  ORF type:complete len:570 (-),score=250.60 TRINITY_DN5433_c0_g1_i1:38-1702(-)
MSTVRQRKPSKKAASVSSDKSSKTSSNDKAESASSWSLNEVTHCMFDRVPAHSIAMARIFWGLVMAWEIYTYTMYDFSKTYHQLVRPTFMFHYFGIWVPRLTFEQWKIFHYCMLVFAGMFSAGLLYHVAALLFALGFTFLFLQDMSFYLNHFYLVMVLCYAYTFVPANRFWSLDAALGIVKKDNTVPFWTVFLTRALVSVVYIYAGIAKMNEDWIRGEPLAHWLPRRSHVYPSFAWYFDSYYTALFMSWAGLLFDTFVPFFFFVPLPIPYARQLAFVASFLFHIMNKLIFNIGIFPYVMSTVTTIFFRSDWPRVVYRFVFTRDPAPARPASPDETRRLARTVPLSLGQKATLALLSLFLLQQTATPLRHNLYQGDVVWNEEGHLGSWRMKLRDKAGMTKYYVRFEDPYRPGEIVTDVVEPQMLLTNGQAKKMSGRPQMILLFALHLADVLAEKLNGTRPQVHVVSIGSVNYRPPQYFIDPRIDLASLPPWTWVHDFVLDLVPLGEHEGHPALATGGKDTGGDQSKNRLFKAYGHLELDDAIEQFSAAMKKFGRE